MMPIAPGFTRTRLRVVQVPLLPMLWHGVLCFVLLPSLLHASDLPRVAPGEVGLSSEKLDDVTEMLKERVAQEQVSGAVALVARNGKIAYFEALGMSNRETQQPMSKESMFRIASMTKPVTSVAIMMLYDEGKLDLQDPVSKFIPEFAQPTVLVADGGADELATMPAEREITIHDLLTHTSGITYSFLGGEPLGTLYRRAGVSDGIGAANLTNAENVERIASLPLMHQPGAQWTYGLSTDVLGRVIEVVSGQPLDKFFESRIFEPLGMVDTHFYLAADKEERLATLYRPAAAGQGIEPSPQPFAASGDAASHTLLSGGAGLISTAEDYARFLQMLLNKGRLGDTRLLREETVARMTENQIGEKEILFTVHGTKFGYGFGIADRQLPTGASAGAYSWGGIYHTFYWVDPEKDLVGIIMTQLFPFDHLTLWADYQQAVYESLEQSN